MPNFNIKGFMPRLQDEADGPVTIAAKPRTRMLDMQTDRLPDFDIAGFMPGRPASRREDEEDGDEDGFNLADDPDDQDFSALEQPEYDPAPQPRQTNRMLPSATPGLSVKLNPSPGRAIDRSGGDLGAAISAAAIKARGGDPDAYYREYAKNLQEGNQNRVARMIGSALTNQQASNQLWEAVGRDRNAYMRAVNTGQLPYQLEDEARAAAKTREANADQRMYREEQRRGEQMRIQNELQQQKAALDREVQMGRLSVEQARQKAAEAESAAGQKLRDSEQTWKQRQGEKQLELADREMQVKYGTAEDQRLDKQLDRDLKTAQIGALKGKLDREASGELEPGQAKDNERKASQRAQELVDNGLDPDEAQTRAAREFGVELSKVKAGKESANPMAERQRLTKLGYTDDNAAFKAALEEVVANDPEARTLLGDQWTADKAGIGTPPLRDPKYKRANEAKIVRTLVARGVPAAQAAKITRARINSR